MGEKASLINDLKKFFQKVSGGWRFERVLFFGSRAKGGGGRDSDVDLIVVSKDFRGQAFHERPVEFYMQWDLQLPVDFICLTPEEFRQKARAPTIVQEAVKTGIRLV